MWRIVYFKAIISLVILSIACNKARTPLPYYNSPDFTPIFINNNEANKKIPHQIEDFELIDQHNQTFSSNVLDGKIHVANFIFTSCGSICPVMTNHMGMVNDAFEQDAQVKLLSFSVTPWIDTPEKLLDFTQKRAITSKNWHFLTGNRAQIYQLARKSYFAEEDLGFTKDSTDFLHTEHFILVDQSKRIRGIYNGTLKLEIKQLIEDIKILKENL